MLYGAHSYIFCERWADDQLELLATARELGLDCFEIALGEDVAFDLERTRRRAQELGLRLIVSPGGQWPDACDLSSPLAAEREGGLRWHLHNIDIAARLGAETYSGAIYGRPGVVRRGKNPADEYDAIAEGLHQLAEHGAQHGVQVVLEPMSHFRTHVANTSAQVMDLIARADHPNLLTLLDTYHMVTEVRDYAAAIMQVRERLWGIHTCESDRGVPGDGLVPWPEVFATLKTIGFDGYLLFESYNSSIGNFAYQRGLFHDVCPDGAAFVRQGLDFVRQGLA